MALKGILSIGGKPGLFKHVAQSKNAIIVEDIETGKRTPAYATAKISALEDIQVFTEEDEVSLVEIFKTLKNIEDGKETLNPKSVSADDIKAKFAEVLPNYDKDRVYVSDMKKIFSWYNFLQKHNLLDFEDEAETDDNTEKENKEESKEKQ